LLSDLRSKGIAMTTVDQLVGDTPLFGELDTAVQQLEQALAGELEHTRLDATRPGFKTYQVELLGPHPMLDPSSIFVRFALHTDILRLVNSYFRMHTRLQFFNVWHTMPSKTAPRNSQLWHRDPEDRCIMKMFVYLSDVDEGCGPLTYAAGTHEYGHVHGEPESSAEEGTSARRSSDEQMSAVVPKDTWVTATGPKGTVVFADTRGYHKGGWARTQDRILYNCMFTSAMTTRGEYFERVAPIMFNAYDEVTRFALGG